MAVQAQYPSNALLFHMNEQETTILDYTLQGPPFFPTGGGSNTRKRVRETTPATAATGEEEHHLPPTQPSPCPPPATLAKPQRQTHRHHLSISAGLRLSLEEQSQPEGQLQNPPQTYLSSSLSGDLATMCTLQTDEIDRFVQAQGEHLRQALAEITKTHRWKLAAMLEESFSRRLLEEEAELEKAARRNAELEDRAKLMAAESMTWQAKARAAEAAAADLQAQLRQATAAAAAVPDKGESDSESACVDPRREEVGIKGAAACRWCGVRAADVLVLPCRHLCLCRSCGQVVENCPVCFCFRSACMQVYLF